MYMLTYVLRVDTQKTTNYKKLQKAGTLKVTATRHDTHIDVLNSFKVDRRG